MAAVSKVWTATADRLGVVASTLCFLHCLATPVVLSLSAVYAHFLPSEEGTHRVLAVLVTLLGVFAIGSGYRTHKRKSVLVFTGLGILLVSSAAAFGDRLPSHRCEIALTLVGGCCMIVAHRMNHTFCGRCVRCE